MAMCKDDETITLNDFKLTANPFRLTPMNMEDSNLIWAGFHDIKQKFENRIKKAIAMPNSSVILNWGEYGSGKTHALRYFGKQDILKELSGNKKSPYFISIDFPQSKKPVWDIYKSIIDRIDFDQLQSQLSSLYPNGIGFIDKISDNFIIREIISFITTKKDSSVIREYLYDTLSTSDFKNEKIQRRITESDYVDIISALFYILTANKSPYSCVILWIDEFEDIAIQSMSNINLVNNFIRQLIDKVSDNLLIFINLTQSAMIRSEDLSEYLIESVKSRIRERISLEIPTGEEVKEYLDELLNNKAFRIEDRDKANIFFPFEESVIDSVINDLKDPSLRRLNEAFSLLLESALFDNKMIIDNEFYTQYKEEVIGWK